VKQTSCPAMCGPLWFMLWI